MFLQSSVDITHAPFSRTFNFAPPIVSVSDCGGAIRTRIYKSSGALG